MDCLKKIKNDNDIILWNFDWLNKKCDLYKKVKNTKMVDEKILKNINETMHENEVNIFTDTSYE